VDQTPVVDVAGMRAHLELSGAVTIEALPERYFARGHLPGAVRATSTELLQQAARLIPDVHTPVVVYCTGSDCPNSHEAARVLERLGYADVKVFAGGKEAWTAAELPLEVDRA